MGCMVLRGDGRGSSWVTAGVELRMQGREEAEAEAAGGGDWLSEHWLESAVVRGRLTSGCSLPRLSHCEVSEPFRSPFRSPFAWSRSRPNELASHCPMGAVFQEGRRGLRSLSSWSATTFAMPQERSTLD